MVLILEPVNREEGDVILDTTTGVHATTAMNATTLPPPPPQPEDASPSPEANEVLTNLVNLLRQ